jgi:hypothetical protein
MKTMNLNSYLKKSVKYLISKAGFKIIRKSEKKKYNLDYTNEIGLYLPMVQPYSMLSFIKLAVLYEQAVHCEKNDIEGAFVECGVWKGGAVGMMALANLKHGIHNRSLYLFDAFDDICEPNMDIDGKTAIEDIETLLGRKVNNLHGNLEPIKGIYDSRGGHGTIETCKNLLVNTIGYPDSKIHFCKGWFEETMHSYAKDINKIAILRLDADWYSSTKVCLDVLYPKVSNGGIIIIDDYGRYDGCKKAVDEFCQANGIKPFLNYSNYEGGECRYFFKS